MPYLGNSRLRLVAIVVVFGLLFAPFSMPFRVPLLSGAALIWTYLESRSVAPVGLGRHDVKATLAWAVAIFVGVTALGQITEPAVNWLFGAQSDLSGYGALKGNAQLAIKLLAFALTSASIGEEILFRGFLMHQLTALFEPGGRARWAIIVASGILFGLAHHIQGPVGIVSTGLVGTILGWAWFKSGRNLWALIIAHALIDSFGIAMLYFGWIGF